MRFSTIVVLAILPVLVAAGPTTGPSDQEVADSVGQTLMILRARLAALHPNERTACAEAIESLERLRARDTWPAINSPVAITGLQKTAWLSAPDASGFQQRISFSTGGAGSWDLAPQTIPMSFNWLIEADRLRILNYRDWRKAFNYEIVSMTYRYSIGNNTLTLTHEGQTLTFTRAQR